ncbi:MAG: exo-alpha-sialidase [Paenibacillaceae bacterium]|nr:exo-alpha-sialidase [Paenibacillaceae bacterium]
MHQPGTVVLDLRPSAGNPRNSEGAFLDLNDGRILFVYSRFTGSSPDDNAYACIAARYSSDRGMTWSDDEIIALPEDHGAINIMSVSLLRMADGDVGLFYLIRRGWHDQRLHLRRSADEGRTWSEPVCCVPGPGNYDTHNDRIVRLSSGRLVNPASFHKMRGNGTNDWDSLDMKGTACFFLSDDDGATWRQSDTSGAIPDSRSASGLQEPGVVELANGVLWSWSRTDMGRQYEMFSWDGGETWTAPAASPFTSPLAPLSMKRIPLNLQLLAVWNPIPQYQTRALERHSWGRTPLVGAFSADEGKTWERFFAVEREEDRGGCCYTSIHVSGDVLLLAYCAGEPEDGTCLTRLKIRRIDLTDLLAEGGTTNG